MGWRTNISKIVILWYKWSILKILFIILFFATSINAQTIRLAFAGDSHCNGGFGLGDSNWLNRTRQFFIDRGYSVQSYKFCSGGETIRTNMPSWYPGSGIGKTLDDILAVNPDIIFFLQSGNHTAFGIKQDTSKYCYTYISDTLRLLGKRFMFSSIGPRQNTYTNGMNFASYNAQADSLNSWLYATFPGQIFNIWDTLRNKSTNKPYAYLLRSDSLHYEAPGHRRIWQMTIRDGKVIDTLAGYDKIHAYNMSFAEGLLSFSSANIKYITIFGSNDGINFIQLDYEEFTTSTKFSIPVYKYIKIVVRNATKTITVTKMFT